LEIHKDKKYEAPYVEKIKELMGANFIITHFIGKATKLAIEHDQSAVLVWLLEKCLELELEVPYIGKDDVDAEIKKGYVETLKQGLDNGMRMRDEQATLVSEQVQSAQERRMGLSPEAYVGGSARQSGQRLVKI